jgi:PiT family inorganic phosphate transporter
MLEFFAPGSPALFLLLILCLGLVLFFEFSNGFHDTANAVATVIYTHSLKATQAVLWSGLMNFLGVLAGGIAVAYALVELIPPDVLTPPDGALAVGMLVALTLAALTWNVGTWGLGIPNSSSHALVGALIGIALEYGLVQGHSFTGAVNWHQVGGGECLIDIAADASKNAPKAPMEKAQKKNKKGRSKRRTVAAFVVRLTQRRRKLAPHFALSSKVCYRTRSGKHLLDFRV